MCHVGLPGKCLCTVSNIHKVLLRNILFCHSAQRTERILPTAVAPQHPVHVLNFYTDMFLEVPNGNLLNRNTNVDQFSRRSIYLMYSISNVSENPEIKDPTS